MGFENGERADSNLAVSVETKWRHWDRKIFFVLFQEGKQNLSKMQHFPGNSDIPEFFSKHWLCTVFCTIQTKKVIVLIFLIVALKLSVVILLCSTD